MPYRRQLALNCELSFKLERGNMREVHYSWACVFTGWGKQQEHNVLMTTWTRGALTVLRCGGHSRPEGSVLWSDIQEDDQWIKWSLPLFQGGTEATLAVAQWSRALLRLLLQRAESWIKMALHVILVNSWELLGLDIGSQCLTTLSWCFLPLHMDFLCFWWQHGYFK